MKKYFSLFAAALLSSAAFAFSDGPTPATTPSTADFNGYKAETANVVVGFYTTAPVCNDIVWVGTANGWADQSPVITFEPMEGFSNWYVCSFNDKSESINGKPVQLKSDGSFAWDYQVGDSISLLSGIATIGDGYPGEVDITGCGTAEPVVLASNKWKNGNNPCVTVPKHTYKIILDAPLCESPEKETFAPAIIGGFNGWAEGLAMTLNEETLKYEYELVEEAEGTEFKFRAFGDTDWSNQIQKYDSVQEKWNDLSNNVLPVATKDTTIEFDFSGDNYRYTKCDASSQTGDTVKYTITVTVAPFCQDLAEYVDSVQITGYFDNWSGTLMEQVSPGVYTATVTAVEGEGYKIKAGTGWDVEPVKENGTDGLDNQLWPFGTTTVALDLSTYAWKGCATAIDEVVFNKATSTKVMIDGRLYIICDGVRYNAQGIKE